jgi:hypothetical protein
MRPDANGAAFRWLVDRVHALDALYRDGLIGCRRLRGSVHFSQRLRAGGDGGLPDGSLATGWHSYGYCP